MTQIAIIEEGKLSPFARLAYTLFAGWPRMSPDELDQLACLTLDNYPNLTDPHPFNSTVLYTGSSWIYLCAVCMRERRAPAHKEPLATRLWNKVMELRTERAQKGP